MNNKKEMNKTKYKEKLDPKVEVLFNVANTHLQFLEGYNEKQEESFETLLGAQIFYLNECKEFNYSGKISEKAKEDRDNSKSITDEHYHPRKSSAKQLVGYLKINKGITFQDAKKWIKEKHIKEWGRYHKTTAKENKELRKAYKKPAKKPSNWSKEKYDNWKKAETWEEAYDFAKIVLINDTK